MNVDYKEAENQTLANLLKNKDDIKLAVERRVDPSFFVQPEAQKIFKLVLWQYDYNQTILDADSFNTAKTLMSIPVEGVNALQFYYQQLQLMPAHTCFKIHLEKFLEVVQNGKIITAQQKANEFLNANDLAGAMNALSQGIMEVEKMGEDKDVECGYMGRKGKEILFKIRDRKEHPEKYRGIMTGFAEFDAATNGLLVPSTTVIMGQQKSGKSVLVTNIAHNVIMQGKKVLYHVNEGGEEIVHQRFLSRATDINFNSILKGTFTPQDETRMETFLIRPEFDNKFYIHAVTSFYSSAASIDAKLTEVEKEGNPMDLVLVDHLGSMDTKRPYDNQSQKIGLIYQELMAVAKRHKVAMIILTHVNKMGMKSKGESYDVSDIGLSIEPLKYADNICSWRIVDAEIFNQDNKGEGVFGLVQSRHSGTKNCRLAVDTNFMRICDMGFQTTLVPAPTAPAHAAPTPPAPPATGV